MLAVMAGFLFLTTANTTILSAAKNGLFLSVYPGRLIPHAIIAAALGTAVVALVFTGVVAGTARRSLAVGLTVALAATIVVSRILFGFATSTTFVVYLLLSAVQVLVLTHAWDYVSDLITGRAAKRLLPLIGMGASIGAIVGGMGVAPAALRLGTDNLLWISVGLLLAALPLLWAVPEPEREPDETTVDMSAVRAFVVGASQGFRWLGGDRLLRLLAVGLIALTLAGTLIDLQLKVLLQESFTRDRITAVYGVMAAVVGTGTLVLQLWASRVLFPKFGVSFAAMLQGGALLLAAGGAAVVGGVFAFAAAQALDDILQFSLQKPVEQVSLLPFPARVKSVSLATLGGVLRPLSKAAGGALALVAVSRPDFLPVATVLSAAVALAVYTRHQRVFMAALEGALARHAVDFGSQHNGPLVADAGALSAIDRGLRDADPHVVVFAVSLLSNLPWQDALPRTLALLTHPAADVRAEAALTAGRIEPPPESGAGAALLARLSDERAPFVLASLLASLGDLGGVNRSDVEPFLEREDRGVRQKALVAMGKLGDPDIDMRLRRLLRSREPEDQAAAAGAVGELEKVALLDDVAAVIEHPIARPAALGALSRLGPVSVPVLARLLLRRDLALPLRRSAVTTLASIPGRTARDALVALVGEPALGPPALTSLTRLRAAGKCDPVEPELLKPVLAKEIRRGLRYAVAAGAIVREGREPRLAFVANELGSLQERTVHRVLGILSLSYDPARLAAVADAVLGDDAARRNNAMELLEGTISQESGSVVIPFMEGVVDGLTSERASDLLGEGAKTGWGPVEGLLDEPDWWPRALALHVLGRDDEITVPGRSKMDDTQEQQMIPLIERVMILKGSELFRNLPGSDLAGIASIAKVVHVAEEEVVFELGDHGDAFYMVVQGTIGISRGTTELALLGPHEGFGEMAILDGESRSARATAREPTTLLRIDRDSFDQVIEQNPAVARGIYRVLTQRLRNTLAQIAAG